jgi:predicted PurR-regulated permease PerM
MKREGKILLYSALFIVATYFLFAGLVYAEPFLVPVFTAMVLAFMMIPVAKKFEKWGFHKILATTISTLILLLVAVAFMAVLFFQVRGFADDWEEIQEKLEENLIEFTQYLVENTPLQQDYVDRFGLGRNDEENGEQEEEQKNDQGGEQEQNEWQNESESENVQNEPDSAQEQNEQEVKEDQGQNGEEDEEEEEMDEEAIQQEAQEAGEQVINIVSAVTLFITNFLITFIYVFLFIHFRSRLKIFILRFFPRHRREKIAFVVSRSSSVSRRYLAGRLFLMIILTGLYYAGLAISGLQNAFFISLIAAALSIIPFVGNIIGYFIAIGVALLTNGETGSLIGITITFIIAQFVDTYILQPIVLGDRVDVHPLFIILSVILGNEVWGVMGMALAIPIFGMITVICRNVPELNPFGYLFSKNDLEESDGQQ